MRKILLMLAWIVFIVSYNVSGQPGKDDQCYICHEAIGDKAAQLYSKDIHFRKGISCAGCHGGDSSLEDMESSMDRNKGFIGVPKGNKISDACINCHSNERTMNSYNSKLPTNQFEQLANSVHGKLSTTGVELIVQCITCHSIHQIKSAGDPSSSIYSVNIPGTCSKCHSDALFMRAYNPALPVDQYIKYRTSRHGILNAKGDSKAADCKDCHGSHDIKSATDIRSKVYPVNLPKTCSGCHSDEDYMRGYKIPADQYKKYSESVHGIALLQKNDPGAPACNDCHGNHGASPPGVESISKVCGTCHALNAELFSNSVHKAAFDKHDYPECESCHGNHDIIFATHQLIGVTEGSSCLNCHTESEDPGFKAAALMRSLIDSLDAQNEIVEKLIYEAEQKGMEVSEAKFKLRDVTQSRLEARTLVHSFDTTKFNEGIRRGLLIAGEVSSDAGAAIDEYYFRRVGLVVSVVLISFLIIGLFLYIKKIET